MHPIEKDLPSLSSDYFQFFGIPRRLAVDTEALQRRFYDLTRRLHPDRFGNRGPAAQQYSLDATALLNDGLRILRDPVTRAEYILKQEGFDIGEQRSHDVPPELLEEVFEFNMAVEELRGGDDSARPQLEEARAKFLGMRDRIDSELQTLFARFDETGNRAVLAELRGVLNRRRYIQNLVNEVNVHFSN